MSTIEIAKDAIPWDACATVVTGILAVGAAIYVGRKQTAIADRQVQLLARQAYLQGMSYKEALFERRFVVYAATQELLATSCAMLMDLLWKGAGHFYKPSIRQNSFSIPKLKLDLELFGRTAAN